MYNLTNIIHRERIHFAVVFIPYFLNFSGANIKGKFFTNVNYIPISIYRIKRSGYYFENHDKHRKWLQNLVKDVIFLKCLLLYSHFEPFLKINNRVGSHCNMDSWRKLISNIHISWPYLNKLIHRLSEPFEPHNMYFDSFFKFLFYLKLISHTYVDIY